MAQSEPIVIEEDQDVVGILCGMFSSTELRKLASNVGVSRERGDTKGETGQKLVTQDPALAARILENDWEVDTDATPFKENREVGEEMISLAEAMRRARNRKMHSRLEELSRATPFGYKTEVDWEYGQGLTSILVKPAEDFEVRWSLKGRAHAILTKRGAARKLEAKNATETEFTKGHSAGTAWALFLKKIEGFYTP